MSNTRLKEAGIIAGAVLTAGAILWAFLAPSPINRHAAPPVAVQLPAPRLPSTAMPAPVPDADVPAAAAPAEALTCAYPSLKQTLSDLAAKCSAQATCTVTGGRWDPENSVDMDTLLEAARSLPVEAVYFGDGRQKLSDAQTDRVGRFVEATLDEAKARDQLTHFMVFGSASPTGSQPGNDIVLAGRRAEAVSREVITVSDDLDDPLLARVHRTNIGRDTLEADYCDRLPDALQEGCRAQDENRRRQVTILLAVPHECLGRKPDAEG